MQLVASGSELILGQRLGETATASLELSANAGQGLIGWNACDLAGADFITAPERFGGPRSAYILVRKRIKALNQAVGQERPCITGK